MKDNPLNIQDLRKQLDQVEAELADTLQRIPAHGIKPSFMAGLLDLEDERDRLLCEIKVLMSGSP